MLFCEITNSSPGKESPSWTTGSSDKAIELLEAHSISKESSVCDCFSEDWIFSCDLEFSWSRLCEEQRSEKGA